jgi:hypothetical protein
MSLAQSLQKQITNAQVEGFGVLGLMETLCPSNGVERLGAESAGEHVRWVGAIWYVPLVSAIL